MTVDCNGRISCKTQSKEETGEKGEDKDRCHGPVRGQNTNDDDQSLEKRLEKMMIMMLKK